MKNHQIVKQSVGIDISKDNLDCSVMQRDSGNPYRVISGKAGANDRRGLAQLWLWMNKHRADKSVPLTVIMEATGTYYEDAAYFFHDQGCHVCVILPNQFKDYARSLGQKSKTDEIDARLLARLGLEREMPAWQPACPNMLTIKRLSRERDAAIEEQTVISNRLHAMQHAHNFDPKAIARQKKAVKFFKEQIKEIEAQIKTLVDTDSDLKNKIDTVCTIKGVGLITAVTVIAETNGFALFKNKAQLVSYAGYDVKVVQSGTSLNLPGRISKKGNPHIRKALYFPAITAVKYMPSAKETYQRIFNRTAIKMKGYVAVQRKLLVMIYAIYKSGKPYDPKHTSEKIGQVPVALPK